MAQEPSQQQGDHSGPTKQQGDGDESHRPPPKKQDEAEKTKKRFFSDWASI